MTIREQALQQWNSCKEKLNTKQFQWYQNWAIIEENKELVKEAVTAHKNFVQKILSEGIAPNSTHQFIAYNEQYSANMERVNECEQLLIRLEQ